MSDLPKKQYTGHRSLEQIAQLATLKGWGVNSMDYDIGGDWVLVFVTLPERPELDRVLYSPLNGMFIGEGFTANSPLDGQPWFVELLDFFYVDEQPTAKEQA